MFRKYHGLGNDYLVLEDGLLTPDRVAALCDRHRGLGADGILQRLPSERADAGLRIWNPDGSIAEKSGNGLRIFARWMVEHQQAPDDITVELTCGVVRCQVDGAMVTVQIDISAKAGRFTWPSEKGGRPAFPMPFPIATAAPGTPVPRRQPAERSISTLSLARPLPPASTEAAPMRRSWA